MKKLFTIIAAISMLAVSCQKENIIINNDEDTSITTGKLTARFAGTTTRVDYTVMYDDDWEWPYDYDEDDYWMGLLPAWEVGDEIIGFDDSGNTYTLTVASIDSETATLSGTVPDGTLHLIYKYGAQASDISNKTLTVDYSGQAGDKTMPAVMLADGTVVGGSCDFTFTNAGAVIDIWFMDDLPLDTKVTKVTLSGENLSAATIALNGSNKLALNATENADDAITIEGLDLTVVEDDFWGNILSSPVWIAVPGGALITKISVEAKVPDPEPKPIPSLDPASIDYVTIAGKKWAKWNIGAENEKDYGWYFSWGGMERYYRHLPDTDFPNEAWWKLPPVVFTDYPWDTNGTAYAGTHYLPDPSFEIEIGTTAYSFAWEYTPFNNGTSLRADTVYFNSIKDTVCPLDGDGNRNLVSAYDAAHVIWGGTWRMPTEKDFMDLIVACGGTYVKQDYSEEILSAECTETPLPSANPGKGIYWLSAEQTYISDYTGVAGVLFCDGSSKLFFPAGGYGNGIGRTMTESLYWSSTLHQPLSSASGNARSLRFLDPNDVNVQSNDGKVKTDFKIRMFGEPIRPISDL